MSITILAGDTVDFSNIGGNHTVLEVNSATWNANQATPLSGGFSLGLGGGMLMTAGLSQGMHYYVCQPHADDGMKGTILIQGIVGIGNATSSTEIISAFPNPFKSSLTIVAPGVDEIIVYNMLGRKVAALYPEDGADSYTYEAGSLKKGIYFFSFRREHGIVETRRLVRH